MDQIEHILNLIRNVIWGVPLLTLLLGTGIYLTYLLRGFQFRYLFFAFRLVMFKEQKGDKGDISPFAALMTSLAGAIGTGTIVGVATAISIGGFGAIFWMWITSILSLATKYAESLLAIKYRTVDKKGEMSGGPMQYMERGLNWKWLAVTFAAMGCIATIGTGNLVQVNSIAEAMGNVTDLGPWTSGVIIAFCVGLVILGGVKSIGNVATILVPFMALVYMGGGLTILAYHWEHIPEAFGLIFDSAFSGQAAFGGFAGSTLLLTIQLGVSRSVLSNEAGLGISSMVPAAARTDSPAKQALITMTGAVMSTLIVSTVTALVLGVTGVHGQLSESGVTLNGATMAIRAFESTLFGGRYIVTVGLILFAFTTVIAWAYYGEKCFEYIVGERWVFLYRGLYTLAAVPAAALNLKSVWYFADITNGLMVLPNLIALIALSGVVVAETKIFMKQISQETAYELQ